LDILGLNGNTQGAYGRGLETEVGFEVLGDFTDETLERQFTDPEFGGLLVTTNFTKSDGTRAVSVGFL
jgi:hypothetical protein